MVFFISYAPVPILGVMASDTKSTRLKQSVFRLLPHAITDLVCGLMNHMVPISVISFFGPNFSRISISALQEQFCPKQVLYFVVLSW